MSFENKEDCPPVESYIWNCIGFDYGEFAGIKELSFAELLTLRSLIDHQVNEIFKNSEDS